MEDQIFDATEIGAAGRGAASQKAGEADSRSGAAECRTDIAIDQKVRREPVGQRDIVHEWRELVVLVNILQGVGGNRHLANRWRPGVHGTRRQTDGRARERSAGRCKRRVLNRDKSRLQPERETVMTLEINVTPADRQFGCLGDMRGNVAE